MKTIYLVTQGSYSEYRVLAAFASRDVASQCASSILEAEVLELPVFDRIPAKALVYIAEQCVVVDGAPADYKPEYAPSYRSYSVSELDGKLPGRPVVNVYEDVRLVLHGRLHTHITCRTVRVSGAKEGEVIKALYDTVARIKAEAQV